MTSDVFLSALLTHRRQAVVESFTRAANGRKHPTTTPTELAYTIANAGAPRFAGRLQPYPSR